jgi:hypothetical protein
MGKKLKTLGRVRSIKPELWFDFELAKLPIEARFAFIGLLCHADREGRFEDNPLRLKALVYPYDKVDMDKILAHLSKKPFIIRYSVDSKSYIQIVKWDEHQPVHHTETESKIPPCNGNATVNSPLTNGEGLKTMSHDSTSISYSYSTSNKKTFKEFVKMTDEQYAMLCDTIGKNNTDSYIERLNDYIGAKGKRYNSHYHVIKGWYRRDNPEVKPQRML